METCEKVSICFLHENPQLLNQCAELLNKQWTRSISARIQSLEKSFKDLPDSVLLIEEINGVKYVIGHSRITRVLEDSNGCWIQSVVISEEKRNLGYGRFLMKKTEEYAKKLNFSTAYLNTHDKMKFYEHLGYDYCKPVSSVSFRHGFLGSGLTCQAVNKHCSPFVNNPHGIHNIEYINTSNNIDEQTLVNVPPPPPPLPQTKAPSAPTLKSNLGQYWMKKTL